MSEASDLLEQLADVDIAACGTPGRLSIVELEKLSGPRKRNVLRRAIRLCGLPAPPATGLVRIVKELIPARADAQPLVEWPGGETRRYRDELFVLASTGAPANEPDEPLYPGRGPVWLGAGMGYLEAGEPGQAPGIDPDLAGRGLVIRYRSGGESIRLSAGGGRRKLKNLMQEKGILPWMRDRVPLLFAGDELVAVADLWVSSDHRSAEGVAVTWTGKPAIL